MIEAGHARATKDHNDRAWLAWNTAALIKTNKLPRLDRLLLRKVDQQTPEEVIENVHRLARMYRAKRNG